jgi:hypothetical protein
MCQKINIRQSSSRLEDNPDFTGEAGIIAYEYLSEDIYKN